MPRLELDVTETPGTALLPFTETTDVELHPLTLFVTVML
jgi:hypothetical protein